MTGGINDGDVIFGCLELPESDVNGNTTFTLSFQFIENPGIFEGTLSKFDGLFLEFLNCSFIDSTTFVDEMACSSGLARVDVSNNDAKICQKPNNWRELHVNMRLFFILMKHSHWIGLALTHRIAIVCYLIWQCGCFLQVWTFVFQFLSDGCSFADSSAAVRGAVINGLLRSCEGF